MAIGYEAGDYWVRGMFQILESNQKLFYTGCSNCFSKIKIDPGIEYDCPFSEKRVTSCTRPFVVMSIKDNTGTVEVAALGDVAERILQSTTEKIASLNDMEGQLFDLNSIRNDLENKSFLILLRRSTAKRVGFQRRPMLMAYYDECMDNIVSTGIEDHPPEERDSRENTLSPLKRQLNEMHIDSGSSSKRQLIMDDTSQNAEDDESTTSTPQDQGNKASDE